MNRIVTQTRQGDSVSTDRLRPIQIQDCSSYPLDERPSEAQCRLLVPRLEIVAAVARFGRRAAQRSALLIGALTCLVGAAQPASAALVEVDLGGVPQADGPATLDTHSGLIWLDLHTQAGVSYDAAEGYLGFRHATEPEVRFLLEQYAELSSDSCTAGPIGLGGEYVFSGGCTGAFGLPGTVIVLWQEGVFDDANPSDGVGTANLFADQWAPTACDCDRTLSIEPNGSSILGLPMLSSTPAAGHWMVKPFTMCMNGVDDDADGLVDTLDPDCTDAADNSEYHLSGGDILAVSYELPPALYRVDPVSGLQTELMSLDAPWGVAMGSGGEVFVTETGLDSILELDTLDGGVRIVSIDGALSFPRGLMVEADGQLLLADGDAQEVLRIDRVTGSQTGITTGGTCNAILQPRVLEPSPTPGNVAFVTDGTTGHVYEIVLDNVCAQRSNGLAITNPWGLLLEDDGQFLVSDGTSQSVVRFNPTLFTETPLYSGTWNFNTPRDMVREADGNVLLADYLGASLYRLDVDTGGISTLSSGPRYTGVTVVPGLPESSPSVPALPVGGLLALAGVLGATAIQRMRTAESQVSSAGRRVRRLRRRFMSRS